MKNLRAVITAGVATLVAVGAFATSSAHADTLQDILARGKIRISVDPAVPPYSVMDESGNWTGPEFEVARKLAADWKLELELVPTSPSKRIPDLLTGRSDVVVSSLSITDERKKVVDFSKPYTVISVVVGGPKSETVTKLEDLIGKRVAVTLGSTNDADLTRLAPAGVEIVRFEDEATSITALSSGQASYYVTAPALLIAVNERNPAAQLEPKIVLKNNIVGVGVKKGEPALLEKLNAWVDAGMADGSLNAIYKAAFGLDLPPELTQAK